MVRQQAVLARARTHQLEKEVYRKYYAENDFLLSPDGLLKVTSAIACVASAAVLVAGGACAGAPALVGGAAGVALASAAGLGALSAGAGLGAPLRAPEAWLYTDIIVSTVLGVLLLVMAVLSMTVCQLDNVASYIHGPLSAITACMVTASAVMTYVAVMRLQDASYLPPPTPRPSTEQEV